MDQDTHKPKKHLVSIEFQKYLLISYNWYMLEVKRSRCNTSKCQQECEKFLKIETFADLFIEMYEHF